VRNRFEDMIIRQSNRVAQMEAPTKEDLMAILPEDLRDEEESTESSDTPESAEKTED
jgi:stage V sporulation protein K